MTTDDRHTYRTDASLATPMPGVARATGAPFDLGPPMPARTGAALKAGDARAWDVIYRTFERPLYGFLNRLAGDPHLATDLVQETFLRTMARFRDIDVPADVKPYLYTAARNLYFKHREKHGRVQTWADTDDALPGGPQDLGDRLEEQPEGALMLDEQAQLVRDAMAKLPDRQRQALALCDLEECSYAQVGEILEMKENAVAQLILRARTKLRLELRLLHTDTSTLPAECVSNLPLISRMLDEALKGDELARLQQHLDACPHCMQAMRDFEEARHRFRAFMPPLFMPVDELWNLILRAAHDGGLLDPSSYDLTAASSTGEGEGGEAAGSGDAGDAGGPGGTSDGTGGAGAGDGGGMGGGGEPDAAAGADAGGWGGGGDGDEVAAPAAGDASVRSGWLDRHASMLTRGAIVAAIVIVLGSLGLLATAPGERTLVDAAGSTTTTGEGDDAETTADAGTTTTTASTSTTSTRRRRHRPRPATTTATTDTTTTATTETQATTPGRAGGSSPGGDGGDANTAPAPKPRPDLVITKISVEGATAYATMANRGSVDSGPFYVLVSIDGNPYTEYVRLVPAGGTNSVAIDTGYCWQGTFSVDGTADIQNGVEESSEKNNGYSTTLSSLC